MMPLVHIAIPCFNEQNFIKDTIESAINQTYSNVEIVVYDNCSTDNTVKIVQSLNNGGKKLGIFQQEKNIGATDNFRKALKLSNGKYFMWLGAHDIISPTYVAEAVELLENNPALGLVYTDHLFINEKQEVIDTPPLSDIDTTGLCKTKGLLKVAGNLRYCTSVHGVFRTEYKTKIPFVNTIAPDHLILFAIAGCSKIKFINKKGYLRREIRKVETEEQRLKRYEDYGMELTSDKYKYLVFEHFKYAFLDVRGLNLKKKIRLFLNLRRSLSFLYAIQWQELNEVAKQLPGLISFRLFIKLCSIIEKYKSRFQYLL
jgi:glycosyltransferase involved in cell wall biosynthesis